MERLPEPELMDDPVQALAYAQADFGEPHEAFVRGFRERFRGHTPAHVLDLGCGPADVTCRFARAYPSAHVLGIDGAPAMIELGQQVTARAGLADRVTLVTARLPGAPLPAQRFDTVISNSLLHHLGDPAVLWEAIKAHAAPRAAMFVMDLLRPGSRAQAQALVDQYAAGEPEILRRDFHNSLLAAFTVEEIRAQLARAGLPFAVDVVSDRHVAVHGWAP